MHSGPRPGIIAPRCALLRPRPEAWTLLLGAAAALASGQRAGQLLGAGILGLLLLAALLGLRSLRSLRPRRHLPAEPIAGEEQEGELDLGQDPGAPLRVLELLEGEEVGWARGQGSRLTMVWRFPRRGAWPLSQLYLELSGPAGLFLHRRRAHCPDHIVVLIRPAEDPCGDQSEEGGRGRPQGAPFGASSTSTDGQLSALRPYQPGDPPRAVHWPTSARTGEPMVVLRAWSPPPSLLIRLPGPPGPRWEEELAIAAGQIDRALRAGSAVGLRLLDQDLPPRSGPLWRRQLLEALATAPPEGP